jgi:hypothetical protein
MHDVVHCEEQKGYDWVLWVTTPQPVPDRWEVCHYVVKSRRAGESQPKSIAKAQERGDRMGRRPAGAERFGAGHAKPTGYSSRDLYNTGRAYGQPDHGGFHRSSLRHRLPPSEGDLLHAASLASRLHQERRGLFRDGCAFPSSIGSLLLSRRGGTPTSLTPRVYLKHFSLLFMSILDGLRMNPAR